jgi:predicted transposase YbfD/YdcC
MKLKKKRKLLKQLKKIEDFRVHKHKVQYPLHEILFMTLFALLKGNTNFKEIHAWMVYSKTNKVFQKVFQRKEVKIPSKSTLHRLLINTNVNQLEDIFRDYFSKHISKNNIAIDGKWLNGSDINAQYTTQSHKAILNVLDKDTNIVFAHQFLDHTKKSEIPAFSELLRNEFFSEEAQIFSFDALLTQYEILNTINKQKNRYIAKVKGNQKKLKEKVIFTTHNFHAPSDHYNDSHLHLRERDTWVTRDVKLYENRGSDTVMYHSRFDNIQSIIAITKTSTHVKTGELKEKTEYYIANYKSTAQDFREKILQHWKIETYHYHLDTLMAEDHHIAHVNPFSISILRSFALNLYQLYYHRYKDEEVLPTGKPKIVDIGHYCRYNDEFASELFEL